jgi:hypothetical protein
MPLLTELWILSGLFYKYFAPLVLVFIILWMIGLIQRSQ